MRRCFWVAWVILIGTGSAGKAAVRWANDAGNPYRRTDFNNIRFLLNSDTAQTIVSDGSAAKAIQAGLDAWNGVPDSAVRFAPLEMTSRGIDSTDQQNVIALATSAAARSAVGSALAVTVISSSQDGRVLDSDILLNPDIRFSTTLQANTYDLRSVVTHELGHSLGANHATVLSATMFWNTLLQDASKRQLKADDASFAVDAYPGPRANAAYGLLTGRAMKDGGVLAGAAVVATDPNTGVVIGGLSSLSDGSFSLRLPAGNYLLFAASLTGPITPANLYNVPGGAISKADTSFRAAAAGGAVNPTLFRVGGAVTVNGSIEAVGGNSTLDIVNAGKIVTTNGVSAFTIGSPPVSAQAGQPLDFIVSGPGLDGSITEDNVRLIGPGVTLRAGTLGVETRVKDASGRSPLRFTIDIAPSTSSAAISLFIVRGADTAFSSGALVVMPSKPVFTAAGVVDAGSFEGSGVAPGELVSLFGVSVGPDPGVVNTGYDPATGALPSSLAGLSVTFDGVRAPLIYASSQQVNLQVPYEVAGHASTVVVVENQGSASDPVSVPVVPTQPGFFTTPAGGPQVIAFNQDGSINSGSSPAGKGTFVTLFATGPGVVSPPVPTGKPALADPLSNALNTSVSIGGMNARVQFAGMAPNFVGLMQINVQIPDGAPSGAVPIQLVVSGRSSPAGTTIFIR